MFFDAKFGHNNFSIALRAIKCDEYSANLSPPTDSLDTPSEENGWVQRCCLSGSNNSSLSSTTEESLLRKKTFCKKNENDSFVCLFVCRMPDASGGRTSFDLRCDGTCC